MKNKKPDHPYYKRRELLNKIRGIVNQPDEIFDNSRAGYWLYLRELKEAVNELSFYQDYEEETEDNKEAFEHNKRESKKFRGY